MATRACLAVILVGASLGLAVDAQSPNDQDVLLSAGHALVGAGQICVVLAIRGVEQDPRLVDAPQLKAQIVDRFSAAGIKHVESAPELVPRLVVRIESTPVPDGDKLVCRVQVALIRQVLLFSQARQPVLAEVWQGRPATAIVAKTGMAEASAAAVASQVAAFIESCKGAGSLATLPSGVKPDRAVSTTSGYLFLSSKSSQVFHRPDCRWAQNIANDNLVGYKSREEAVQAGKRACKTCKP